MGFHRAPLSFGTPDCGTDFGIDYGIDFGTDHFGIECGTDFGTDCVIWGLRIVVLILVLILPDL